MQKIAILLLGILICVYPIHLSVVLPKPLKTESKRNLLKCKWKKLQHIAKHAVMYSPTNQKANTTEEKYAEMSAGKMQQIKDFKDFTPLTGKQIGTQLK